MKGITKKQLLIVGMTGIGVVAAVIVAIVLMLSNKTSGIASVQDISRNWAQGATLNSSVQQTGKTYALTEDFIFSSQARFSLAAVPSSWHVTEDKGSGDEAALYSLESEDKKTTVKTSNSASSLSSVYTDMKACSSYLTDRFSSAAYLEQYKIAAPGTTKPAKTSSYTIITNKGDGVELARVDVSYQDTKGVTHYLTALYRCGKTHTLSVVVNSTESEAAVNKAIDSVVKELILKGV